jgi:hypothetical protein
MADDSYQQLRYNEYSKQRGELFKTNVELGGPYDQWILTLSGGAIALSLAFLEKIASHPEPNTLFLLGLAWFFLMVALLTGLVSLLTAQYSALRQIEILDAEYREWREQGEQGPMPKTPKPNRYAGLTDILNRVSAPSFVLGVLFLCAFAYANIPSAPASAALPPKVDVNVRFQNAPAVLPGRTGATNP